MQKGQEGLVIQKIEKVYEDGKLVYSKMVDKKVKTKQVNQVVAYGTKKSRKSPCCPSAGVAILAEALISTIKSA